MREKIFNIILNSLNELNKTLNNPELNNINLQTALYGKDGLLDSLALITLIMDLEDKISNEFNKSIKLANEITMSFTDSPFKSVENLIEYIEKLINE